MVSSFHLPIVERELRVTARRPGTYWGRVGAGLTALALVSWSVMVGGTTPGGVAAAGRTTFLTLSAVALFSTMLTALRLAAPSLAAEKREGTLGLLFLTDLRSRDIVLGKLAVSSLATFFQFLAAVPALAIPLLMGGVTAGEFIRLVLVLLNLMLLASAVGMCASALTHDERSASGLATILMIVVLGLGPLLALLMMWCEVSPAIVALGFVLSPAYACVPYLTTGAVGFWVSFLIGHAAAWGFLWLTCWLLPRVWRDRPASAPQAVRRERWQNLTQGTPRQRGAARRELLAVNPILWLNARDRTAQWNPWVFLAALGALLLWARIQFNVRWTEPGLVLGLFWIVHAIFKAWMASQSAYVLSADRDRGALELVLSTPLTTEELLRGHWLGLRRIFVAPLLFVLAVESIWILVSLPWAYGGRPGESLGTWIFAHVANLLLFGLDLWAAAWVGLWSGAVAKNSNDATGRTQSRLFWLPWMGVMAWQAASGALFQRSAPFAALVLIWAVFGVIADFNFARRARHHLAMDLRTAAMLRASGQSAGSFAWRARLARWLGLKPGQPGLNTA